MGFRVRVLLFLVYSLKTPLGQNFIICIVLVENPAGTKQPYLFRRFRICSVGTTDG